MFEKNRLRSARFQKSGVFSENSSKRFFAQPKGYKNTEEMLRVIRRHTLEAIFQVMRVAVNHRKGQKPSTKIDVHLKSTLAIPPIYDRAYPEKPLTASTGNVMRVTKPNLLLLFVQQDEKSLEDSKSLEETHCFTIFGKKSRRKSSLGAETRIKTHCCTNCLICC